jgi:hypothetical protein
VLFGLAVFLNPSRRRSVAAALPDDMKTWVGQRLSQSSSRSSLLSPPPGHAADAAGAVTLRPARGAEIVARSVL